MGAEKAKGVAAMRNILIVEDDRTLSDGIAAALKNDECRLRQAHSVATARQQLAASACDLLILDVNLPDGSGLELLAELRRTADTPVILLTANDMETDIVSGLEQGADDYITKPFSLAVLRARVHTQLRKLSQRRSPRFALDGFVFDFDRLEFSRDGRALELSKTEQKLLRLLLEQRGRTLTRDTLIDRVWTDGAEYVDENALSVSIKRLRDKLEAQPSKPRYIKTVYGVGYSWAVNADE